MSCKDFRDVVAKLPAGTESGFKEFAELLSELLDGLRSEFSGTTPPYKPLIGQTYYNTALKKTYRYFGELQGWVAESSSSGGGDPSTPSNIEQEVIEARGVEFSLLSRLTKIANQNAGTTFPATMDVKVGTPCFRTDEKTVYICTGIGADGTGAKWEKISDLIPAIKDLSDRITSVETDVNDSSQDLSSLQQGITTIQNAFTQIQQSVDANTGSIATLQVEINSINQNIGANTGKIEALTQQITVVENNVTNLESVVDEVKTKADANASELANLRNDIPALSESIEELKKVDEEIKLNVQAVESEASNATQEINKLKPIVETHTQEIEQLKQSSSTLEQKVTANTASIGVLVTKTQSLQTEIDSLEPRVQANTDNIAVNTSAIEKIKEDLTQAKTDITDVTDRTTVLETTVNEHTTTIGKHDAEILQARGTKPSLGERLNVSINSDGTLKSTTATAWWSPFDPYTFVRVSDRVFEITGLGDLTDTFEMDRAVLLQSSMSKGYVVSCVYTADTDKNTVTVDFDIPVGDDRVQVGAPVGNASKGDDAFIYVDDVTVKRKPEPNKTLYVPDATTTDKGVVQLTDEIVENSSKVITETAAKALKKTVEDNGAELTNVRVLVDTNAQNIADLTTKVDANELEIVEFGANFDDMIKRGQMGDLKVVSDVTDYNTILSTQNIVIDGTVQETMLNKPDFMVAGVGTSTEKHVLEVKSVYSDTALNYVDVLQVATTVGDKDVNANVRSVSRKGTYDVDTKSHKWSEWQPFSSSSTGGGGVIDTKRWNESVSTETEIDTLIPKLHNKAIIIVDNGLNADLYQIRDGLKVRVPITSNGKSGATFIPSVDQDGNLSWTNNSNLDNPDPVNIKGADGKSAFEIWQSQPGNENKTENEFIEAINPATSFDGTITEVNNPTFNASNDTAKGKFMYTVAVETGKIGVVLGAYKFADGAYTSVETTSVIKDGILSVYADVDSIKKLVYSIITVQTETLVDKVVTLTNPVLENSDKLEKGDKMVKIEVPENAVVDLLGAYVEDTGVLKSVHLDCEIENNFLKVYTSYNSIARLLYFATVSNSTDLSAYATKTFVQDITGNLTNLDNTVIKTNIVDAINSVNSKFFDTQSNIITVGTTGADYTDLKEALIEAGKRASRSNKIHYVDLITDITVVEALEIESDLHLVNLRSSPEAGTAFTINANNFITLNSKAMPNRVSNVHFEGTGVCFYYNTNTSVVIEECMFTGYTTACRLNNISAFVERSVFKNCKEGISSHYLARVASIRNTFEADVISPHVVEHGGSISSDSCTFKGSVDHCNVTKNTLNAEGIYFEK